MHEGTAFFSFLLWEAIWFWSTVELGNSQNYAAGHILHNPKTISNISVTTLRGKCKLYRDFQQANTFKYYREIVRLRKSLIPYTYVAGMTTDVRPLLNLSSLWRLSLFFFLQHYNTRVRKGNIFSLSKSFQCSHDSFGKELLNSWEVSQKTNTTEKVYGHFSESCLI